MNGLWPMDNCDTRRAASSWARTCAALCFVAATGCAHAAPGGGRAAATPLPSAPAAPTAEEARLERQLAERDRTIQQLEGRMAMLEASERQLREQLAGARSEQAESQARETIRIGARARESREPVREPRVVTQSSELQGGEPRPMLRLQGDRMSEPVAERARSRAGERTELTSVWSAPVTTERLTVATVPRLSSLAEAAPSTPPSAPRKLESEAASELYVRALDLLRRREFPEALRELSAFLQGYPDDSRVARAHFWRGEILFAQREFARALAAFEDALLRDPRGDKAADTLLRMARCQQRLGAHERARAALLKLKTQFPDSEAARVASQLTQEDT